MATQNTNTQKRTEQKAETEAPKPEQASMLVKLPAPLYHAFQVVTLLDKSTVASDVRDFVAKRVQTKREQLGEDVWKALTSDES